MYYSYANNICITGLHGKSDIEEAKIDMVVGCFEDMITPLGPIFREKDETKKVDHCTLILRIIVPIQIEM